MASTTLLFPNSLRPALRRWPAIFHIWLPVAVFAAIVAMASTAAFGSNHTSAPLHRLLQALFGHAIDPNWGWIHHCIRKTGHLLGYGVLSFLFYRGFRLSLQNRRAYGWRPWTCHALAIAATFLAGSADELHQRFVPNRTGCFSDVLLDTAGAVALQLAVWLALRLAARATGDRVPQAQASRAERIQLVA